MVEPVAEAAPADDVEMQEEEVKMDPAEAAEAKKT